MVYTVDKVYAVDMVYTVDTVFTFQTAKACLKVACMPIYIWCPKKEQQYFFLVFWTRSKVVQRGPIGTNMVNLIFLTF